MTLTAVCPYIAETETECMKKMNDPFEYISPRLTDVPEKSGFPEDKSIHIEESSVSIPVFAMNRRDGERMNIRTGQLIALENPLKKRIRGKVFLTDEVMPGVIKTAFGPGGQRASGMGLVRNVCDYTPNVNELYDPSNFNIFTGSPAFGDIMVKVISSLSD